MTKREKPQKKSSKSLDKVLLKINSMNSQKRKTTDDNDLKRKADDDQTPQKSIINNREIPQSEMKPPTPKICLKMRRTTTDGDEMNSSSRSHDSYVIVQPQPMNSSEPTDATSNGGKVNSVVNNVGKHQKARCHKFQLNNFLDQVAGNNVAKAKRKVIDNLVAGNNMQTKFEKKMSRRKMKRPEKANNTYYVAENRPKEEIAGNMTNNNKIATSEPFANPLQQPLISIVPPALLKEDAIYKPVVPVNFQQSSPTTFKATSSFETKCNPPPYISPKPLYNKNTILFQKQANEINQSISQNAQQQFQPQQQQQRTNPPSANVSKAVLLAEKYNHAAKFVPQTPMRTSSGEKSFTYKDHVANIERSPEHQKLHANALNMARRLFSDIKPHSDRISASQKGKPRAILPKAATENKSAGKLKRGNYQQSVILSPNANNFDVINAHLQQHKAVLSTQKSKQTNLNNSNSILSQPAIQNFNLKSMLQKPLNGNLAVNSTKTIHPASNSSIEVRYLNAVPAQQLNGTNTSFTYQQQNVKNLNQSASSTTYKKSQNAQRQASSANVRNIAKKYVNINNGLVANSNNGFVTNSNQKQTYNISTIDLSSLQKQLSENKTYVVKDLTVGNNLNLVQFQQSNSAKRTISYQGDQSRGKSIRWTQNSGPKIALVQSCPPPPIIRFTDPKSSFSVPVTTGVVCSSVPVTTRVSNVALNKIPTSNVVIQETPIDFSTKQQ